MEMTSLKTILQQSGIAGCGGAGFPAYAKLGANIDTVILNCAECEPLFKLHRQLLETYAEEIIATLDLLCGALGAERFIIAVKGAYKQTVDAANAAVKDYARGSVCLLEEVYPAGDEVITVYEATGRIVPAGGIPAMVGCVVYNVETVLNMHAALEEGKAITHKYVTVAGEVKHPATYRVPLGMRYDELVALCGGATVEEPVYFAGGPMTGRIASASDVVTKTTNGILIMPQNHYIIQKRMQKTKVSIARTMSSCCQCRGCTDLCPRNLLGHPITPSDFMRAASHGDVRQSEAVLGALYCSQCGLCEMYSCIQGLNPRSLIGEAKMGFARQGVRPTVVENNGSAKAERPYRKVPMRRLIARLNLEKYDVPAPVKTDEIHPAQVKLQLSQHIGKPATAIVKKGEKVKAGQLLAEAAKDALSLPVHAPFDGEVVKVTETAIVLKGTKK